MSDSAADVVVVGAGIVGLAIAAELARAGRSVLIVESDRAIARGVTSRNSEVIHAGLYYPEGSLKARLCTRGREMLYRRCEALGIPHRKTGKIVVAGQAAEAGALEGLRERGTRNGVPGLRLLTAGETLQRVPELRVHAGLLSPETGIVDVHALALSFQAEAEEHGALLLLQHEITGLSTTPTGWRIETRDAEGGSDATDCGVVVNAAGLSSDRVAGLAGIDVDAARYRLHPCKGDYFSLAPSSGFSPDCLVYPVPAPSSAGLGIHATIDLDGRVRFGPDTEYVGEIDFAVRPDKAESFAEAIRRYLPSIEASQLSPDYAGIRPKLAGPGEGFRDFVLTEESERGLPGLVNCIGIESPGVTAAPAIAEYVASLL